MTPWPVLVENAHASWCEAQGEATAALLVVGSLSTVPVMARDTDELFTTMPTWAPVVATQAGTLRGIIFCGRTPGPDGTPISLGRQVGGICILRAGDPGVIGDVDQSGLETTDRLLAHLNAVWS